MFNCNSGRVYESTFSLQWSMFLSNKPKHNHVLFVFFVKNEKNIMVLHSYKNLSFFVHSFRIHTLYISPEEICSLQTYKHIFKDHYSSYIMIHLFSQCSFIQENLSQKVRQTWLCVFLSPLVKHPLAFCSSKHTKR